MFKVYLAAASAEHERARSVAEVLDRSGLVQLPDRWWESAEQWTGRDAEWSHDRAKAIATEHLRLMRECQLVWLLFPEAPSFGAFVELGQALLRKPTLITGARAVHTVYSALADIVAADDATGAVEVFRLAREYADLSVVP